MQSDKVVRSPVTKTLAGNGSGAPAGMRYIRVVELEKDIGLDRFNDFAPTRTLTVMTNGYGDLVTCFPGLLP